MQTVNKIWQDGKFIDWDEAKVHVLAHALHYGSGVFEGVRFYKTPKKSAVFRLKEHIERLFYSAGIIKMTIPFTPEEIMSAILENIRLNGIESGYIRPLAIYGYGKMGLNPKGAAVNLIIAIWPWGSYLGKDLVKVKISRFIRLHPRSVVSDAKVTGHYVNSILASQEAIDAGYDESLLLDFNGNVAEGPGENIFIVKDGKLITVAKGNILTGITRDSVLKIAADLGLVSEEIILTPADLYGADELFFTGTAAEVQPIGQIDEQTINDGKIGPVTAKIKSVYSQAVRGELPQYENWLSYV